MTHYIFRLGISPDLYPDDRADLPVFYRFFSYLISHSSPGGSLEGGDDEFKDVLLTFSDRCCWTSSNSVTCRSNFSKDAIANDSHPEALSPKARCGGTVGAAVGDSALRSHFSRLIYDPV